LKLRFIGIIGAKFRTEILAGESPPGFDVTVMAAEWLVAEGAADRAAIHHVLAAYDH